jgi:hypothetical protein
MSVGGAGRSDQAGRLWGVGGDDAGPAAPAGDEAGAPEGAQAVAPARPLSVGFRSLALAADLEAKAAGVVTEPSLDEIEVRYQSRDEADREYHLNGLRGMTPAEIKAQFAQADGPSIARVLRLLATSNEPEVYAKVTAALRDYCVENHFKNARAVNDIAQAIANMSEDGADIVKGDFAATLEKVIEAPGLKPDFPSYIDLLARVIDSDPSGVVARLASTRADNAEAGKTPPGMLSRIMISIGKDHEDTLAKVLGGVAAGYARACQDYHKARADLVAAERSGDPAKVAAAQQAVNDAEDRMYARGMETGYALRSAENAIAKIAGDDYAKNAMGLRLAKLTGQAFAKIMPEGGEVVAKLTDALAERADDRLKEHYKEWQSRLDTKFEKAIAAMYRASAPGDQKNAGPGTAEGRRYSDREKRYTDGYQDGKNAAIKE